MENAWITQLHRIQNRDLYTYYDIQRRRLLGQSGTTQDGKVAVTEAWHGTGSGDAANIYTDTQDGFMSETHAAGPALALALVRCGVCWSQCNSRRTPSGAAVSTLPATQ